MSSVLVGFKPIVNIFEVCPNSLLLEYIELLLEDSVSVFYPLLHTGRAVSGCHPEFDAITEGQL